MADLDVLGIDNLYDLGWGSEYGSPRRPPRLEMDLCKFWISKYIDRSKKVNKNRSSYGLKHCVEDWAGVYIPNGAFILAAVELGFEYSVTGPNSHFNMRFTRAERTGMIPSKWNHYVSLSYGFGRDEIPITLKGVV